MPILTAIIVLGAIGIVGAIVLYFVSKKFHVYEDPRIEVIEQLLPGANCGSCGRSGCHDFACACASATTLDGLVCPGAGDEAMAKIADIVGLAPVKGNPMVAVLRCNGSCENRPVTANYDGASTCAVRQLTGVETTGCTYGCLGCGDCTTVCNWNAITMDPVTGLPVVDAEKCTGCGACTRKCPRNLLELRPKGRNGMRVWVACANRDRGPLAMKACKVACIGCGKCVKACSFEAVTVTDNLAYIDPEKCKMCRKCILACPKDAIHETGFPRTAKEQAAMLEAKKKENEQNTNNEQTAQQ